MPAVAAENVLIFQWAADVYPPAPKKCFDSVVESFDEIVVSPQVCGRNAPSLILLWRGKRL